MIKNLATILMLFCCITLQAQNDSTRVELNEVTISSFLQRTSNVGGNISYEEIQRGNYGQEPSNLFDKMPSIISLNDNGTEFGYGYYRIRGLDQTRINVSILKEMGLLRVSSYIRYNSFTLCTFVIGW